MGKIRFLAPVLGAFLAVAWIAAAQAQIQVNVASWGYAAERKNVKDDVAKYCDGKDSCTFAVKNESFPSSQPLDPSPGNDKGLMVMWKCGDVAHKEQFAEGRSAAVGCK